jgi:hypothetical protein
MHATTFKLQLKLQFICNSYYKIDLKIPIKGLPLFWNSFFICQDSFE